MQAHVVPEMSSLCTHNFPLGLQDVSLDISETLKIVEYLHTNDHFISIFVLFSGSSKHFFGGFDYRWRG
jgi:hypothetical protein